MLRVCFALLILMNCAQVLDASKAVAPLFKGGTPTHDELLACLKKIPTQKELYETFKSLIPRYKSGSIKRRTLLAAHDLLYDGYYRHLADQAVRSQVRCSIEELCAQEAAGAAEYQEERCQTRQKAATTKVTGYKPGKPACPPARVRRPETPHRLLPAGPEPQPRPTRLMRPQQTQSYLQEQAEQRAAT